MKRTLYGLNFSVFIMTLGVGMVVSFLPNKVIGLTGSTTAVGYLTSAYAVSNILMQMPMGVLSDRLGFKRFLIAGYLLCAVSGFLFYLSRSENMIFFGRMIQGIGEAPMWAIAPALLSVQYPLAKGRVMGYYNASLHIGLTVGPLLGILALKLFPASAEGIAFVFFACACLAAALIIALSVDNPRSGEGTLSEAIRFRDMLPLLSEARILCVLVGIALYGVGYGITLTSIPAYILRFKGYGQTYVQIFFIAFYLAICVSQLVTGPLSDRWGRERFMLFGLTAAAALMALFPALNRVWTIVALMAASLGLGTFYLSSLAYLNGIVPDSLKGAISGTYFLFWGIGYFAGPMLIGHLGELWRGSLGFYCYAALLAAQSLAMARLFRRRIPLAPREVTKMSL